jgi:phage terminase Nu1 subunit (DNA packaging protein)
MSLFTQAELARIVGVSGPQISDLVRRDVIDIKRGRQQSIIDYCAHLREKAAGRSGGGEHDLTEERARLAHHQANIAALDEQVKKKALIPFDVVVERWQEISANVRAKLISIPPQMAARCANSSKDEVERAAKDLIYQALNELARDVEY